MQKKTLYTIVCTQKQVTPSIQSQSIYMSDVKPNSSFGFSCQAEKLVLDSFNLYKSIICPNQILWSGSSRIGINIIYIYGK